MLFFTGILTARKFSFNRNNNDNSVLSYNNAISNFELDSSKIQNYIRNVLKTSNDKDIEKLYHIIVDYLQKINEKKIIKFFYRLQSSLSKKICDVFKQTIKNMESTVDCAFRYDIDKINELKNFTEKQNTIYTELIKNINDEESFLYKNVESKIENFIKNDSRLFFLRLLIQVSSHEKFQLNNTKKEAYDRIFELTIIIQLEFERHFIIKILNQIEAIASLHFGKEFMESNCENFFKKIKKVKNSDSECRNKSRINQVYENILNDFIKQLNSDIDNDNVCIIDSTDKVLFMNTKNSIYIENHDKYIIILKTSEIFKCLFTNDFNCSSFKEKMLESLKTLWFNLPYVFDPQNFSKNLWSYKFRNCFKSSFMTLKKEIKDIQDNLGIYQKINLDIQKEIPDGTNLINLLQIFAFETIIFKDYFSLFDTIIQDFCEEKKLPYEDHSKYVKEIKTKILSMENKIDLYDEFFSYSKNVMVTKNTFLEFNIQEIFLLMINLLNNAAKQKITYFFNLNKNKIDYSKYKIKLWKIFVFKESRENINNINLFNLICFSRACFENEPTKLTFIDYEIEYKLFLQSVLALFDEKTDLDDNFKVIKKYMDHNPNNLINYVNAQGLARDYTKSLFTFLKTHYVNIFKLSNAYSDKIDLLKYFEDKINKIIILKFLGNRKTVKLVKKINNI
ncbi:hypothetical protein GVAV_002937 [Gurleya vavrai]